MSDHNLFAGYLIKLKETHMQIVAKMEGEIEMLKKKCQKMQSIANQNASLAKRYHMKCKFLLKDREKMKVRMKEPTEDGLCKNCTRTEQLNSLLNNSSVTISPSRTLQDLTLSSSGSNTDSNYSVVNGRKLISRKGIKKRNQLSNVGAHQSCVTLSTDRYVRSKHVGGSGKQSLNEPDRMSLIASKNVDEEVATVAIDGHPGSDHQVRILVPETFEPDMSITLSSDDRASIKQTLTNLPDSTDKNERILNWMTGIENTADADTLAPHVDDDMTMIHTQVTPLKAPICCSTPILPKACNTMPFHDISQAKHLSNGDVLHRRSSLPKSESQYPVDLSRTQIPSPTFKRDGSPVVFRDDIENNKQSVTKTISFEQKTPKSHLITNKNESNLSETSPLLFCEAMKTGVSKAAVIKVLRNGKEPAPDCSGNMTEYSCADSKKRKHTDVDTPKRTKKRLQSPDTGAALYDHQDCEKMSKRKKQEEAQNECSTVRDTWQTCDVKSNDEEPQITRLSTGHTLVQKTLQFNYKPPTISRIKEFNGGATTSCDSQSDVYLNQAIKQSLQLMQDSEKKEFKKPFIPPHRAAQRQRGDEDKDINKTENITNSVVLNGSIDPAIDLNEIEADSLNDQEHTGWIKRSFAEHGVLSSVAKAADDVTITKELPPLGDYSGLNISHDMSLKMHQTEHFESRKREPSYNDQYDSCGDMFAGEEEFDDAAVPTQEMHNIQEYNKTGQSRQKVVIEKKHQETKEHYFQNFDQLPTVDKGPQYKHVEVVRKQVERRKLRGFDCKDCQAYFGTMDLTDSQRVERMKACSRHRGKYSPPPATPPHYWDVDFPDTETCIRRGYVNNVTEQDELKHHKKHTRRQPYKQLFKANATK